MIATRRPTSKQSHQGSTTAQKGKRKASSKVRVVVGAAKKVKRHIVLVSSGDGGDDSDGGDGDKVPRSPSTDAEGQAEDSEDSWEINCEGSDDELGKHIQLNRL
jgi:hypothetical protein